MSRSVLHIPGSNGGPTAVAWERITKTVGTADPTVVSLYQCRSLGVEFTEFQDTLVIREMVRGADLESKVWTMMAQLVMRAFDEQDREGHERDANRRDLGMADPSLCTGDEEVVVQPEFARSAEPFLVTFTRTAEQCWALRSYSDVERFTSLEGALTELARYVNTQY